MRPRAREPCAAYQQSQLQNEHKLHELHKGESMYKKWLGLEFERQGLHGLRARHTPPRLSPPILQRTPPTPHLRLHPPPFPRPC